MYYLSYEHCKLHTQRDGEQVYQPTYDITNAQGGISTCMSFCSGPVLPPISALWLIQAVDLRGLSACRALAKVIAPGPCPPTRVQLFAAFSSIVA